MMTYRPDDADYAAQAYMENDRALHEELERLRAENERLRANETEDAAIIASDSARIVQLQRENDDLRAENEELRDGVCLECGHSDWDVWAEQLRAGAIQAKTIAVADPAETEEIQTKAFLNFKLQQVVAMYCWRGEMSSLETTYCQPGLSCRILGPQTIGLILENPRLKFGSAIIESGFSGYVESYTEHSLVVKLGDMDNERLELLPGSGPVVVTVYAIAADSTSGPIIC
jgi:hypothetical protein